MGVRGVGRLLIIGLVGVERLTKPITKTKHVIFIIVPAAF